MHEENGENTRERLPCYCNRSYSIIHPGVNFTGAFALYDTYSLLSEVNLDDVMSGYFVDYDQDIKQNDYIIPGGSMVATAQDVGLFLRALIDGTLRL